MLAPRRTPVRHHWADLTDEQLIDIELETDDPESLPNLVKEVPDGDEEVYVEYKYDLRGSGRDEFQCVHGSHGHLAGFVMRKGESRFLVGWICGGSIYGERFEAFKDDFNAALNRRNTVRRRLDLREQVQPLFALLRSLQTSDVFDDFARLRHQLETRLPWIWDYLTELSQRRSAWAPTSLCNKQLDLRREFQRLEANIDSFDRLLAEMQDVSDEKISKVKSAARLHIRTLENICSALREVEELFQPSNLSDLCELATFHDNPVKRKYVPGLMSIYCQRSGKPDIFISVPEGYRVASADEIDALKKAVDRA